MARPDIHLYTASTMNGWKPTIFLEEARVDYELTFIDFAKKEQKSDWYVALNPNGRIPTIVDRGNDDFGVWRTCLESREIDTVVLFATIPVERPRHWSLSGDFPIERDWMRERPDVFEPVLLSAKAEIYRVERE